MKTEYVIALKKGNVVKRNKFVTEKGTYRIDILVHRNALYFAKYIDDKLVEINKLFETPKILYLCNGEACNGKCSTTCTHTTKISNAKNFRKLKTNMYIEEK